MPPPRLLQDEPLPPYSYVPGRSPHPISDPAGHSFGVQPTPVVFNPKHWRACRTYLRGIDLFNFGFYWEAHEAWEQLWHALGRSGVHADFLKGLIHLAAAGVKMREGIGEGVCSHARRAAELFRAVEKDTSAVDQLLGLKLAQLVALAKSLEAQPPEPVESREVMAVFPEALILNSTP